MIFEVTPRGGPSVIRQGSTVRAAKARASGEFPQGVVSLRKLEAPELSKLVDSGVMLPAAARGIVATYRAVQTVKRRAATAAGKMRQRAAERAQTLADEKRAAAEEEKRKAKEAAKKVRRAAQVLKAAAAALPEVAAVGQLDAADWDGIEAPW